MKWIQVFLVTTFLMGAVAVGSAREAPPYGSSEKSLNGEWSFQYIEGLSLGERESFYEENYDDGDWATIKVPANWEIEGFAEPHYALELQDGLGLYRRTFTVPDTWTEERYYLRFEGVAFGFELWVNGTFAGRSTASAFNRHDFEVTELLRSGKDKQNTVALKVTTKPKGWEFDANDDWALSGIYRDVSLFAVPRTHVADLSTKTTLLDNGGARFSVAAEVTGENGELSGILTDAEGKAFELSFEDVGSQRLGTVSLATPDLWTAETPFLYDLALSLRVDGEVVQTIEERIGLREIEVKEGKLLLNGRPIKLRGVNRHDLAEDVGRAVTERHFLRDIQWLKKGNINFVRTSHYPPHPRFIELCDEYGIYVMCEVSIGKGEEHQDKPDYLEQILARTEATVLRDKNRASVLIWSIGNENPVTDNEMTAGQLALELDETRPICIPKIGSYFADNYERIPEFVQVYSPHYPDLELLHEFDRNLDRPTILTEYAHGLGLATDRIQEEWKVIQSSDTLVGGAIWHFMDQGILRSDDGSMSDEAASRYAWISETEYYDTNGLDGADGLLYSDRRPQTDFHLTRKVYSPVQIDAANVGENTLQERLKLVVENRFDFISLEGYELKWQQMRNRDVVADGTSPLFAPSRKSETIALDIKESASEQAGYGYVRFSVFNPQDEEVTSGSVRLHADRRAVNLQESLAPNRGDRLSVVEKEDLISVELERCLVQVSKKTGEISLCGFDGEQIVSGIYPRIGRVLTMAEKLSAKKRNLWEGVVLKENLEPDVDIQTDDSQVSLVISGRYPRNGFNNQTLVGSISLSVSAGGLIDVAYSFESEGGEGMLAEAGLSVVLEDRFTDFRWVGDGPFAAYPGKDVLSDFGVYHLSLDDHYIRGNRRETELAVVSGSEGGLALMSEPSDVAIEKVGGQVYLSHNDKIGSLGNKGRLPEVQIAVEDIGTISGSFTLLVSDVGWPEPIEAIFGDLSEQAEAYQPYVRSYDQ